LAALTVGLVPTILRIVGQKKRQIWFPLRQYTAAQALEMGLINCVVPVDSAGTGRRHSVG